MPADIVGRRLYVKGGLIRDDLQGALFRTTLKAAVFPRLMFTILSGLLKSLELSGIGKGG